MFKTALRSTLVVGAAVAATFAMGATASAAEVDDVTGGATGILGDLTDVELPDINVGNDACILPWFWQGPFNVAVEEQNGVYVACNDYTVDTVESEDEGSSIDVLNDTCVAPWFWQGPVNFLVGSQDGYYEACN